MLKKFACLAACACLLVSVGCGGNTKKNEAPAKADAYVQLVDDANRKITLAKKPERVLALSPSYLELIDAVGGTLIGRPTAQNGSVPKSMEKLPEVGHTYNINMESVVGLKPDLVLASRNQHAKFIQLLESNKINALEYQVRTYDEVKKFLGELGKIYNTPDKAKAVCTKLDNDIKTIVEKTPKQKKRVVILFATANSVTVAGSKSIAGCVSDILGFENVAAKALKGASDKTPYSMEALLEQNPEIVFITSMGKAEKIEKRLQTDFKNNPAWNGLGAVKNKKVFVLPENMFLINPGIHYPEAVAYMAKLAYPQEMAK